MASYPSSGLHLILIAVATFLQGSEAVSTIMRKGTAVSADGAMSDVMNAEATQTPGKVERFISQIDVPDATSSHVVQTLRCPSGTNIQQIEVERDPDNVLATIAMTCGTHNAPTSAPSENPSPNPTSKPTAAPTRLPTATPTHAPTSVPTTESVAPTISPTKTPTIAPTVNLNCPQPETGFAMTTKPMVTVDFYRLYILNSNGIVYAVNDSGSYRKCGEPHEYLRGVKAIFSGSMHTFFLMHDSSVCGSGKSEALCDAHPTAEKPPVVVMPGPVKSIATHQHLALFLTHEDDAYACGEAGSANQWRATGLDVPNSPRLMVREVQSIATSGAELIFAAKNGSIYATGRRVREWLGEQQGWYARSFEPEANEGWCCTKRDHSGCQFWEAYRPMELPVAQGLQLADKAGNHFFFKNESNALLAMGDNYDFQLGINKGGTVVHPSMVLIEGPVQHISSGSEHSMFLLANGSMFVSGKNEYGQFGTGDRTDSHVPIWIMDGVQAIWADIRTSIIIFANKTISAAGKRIKCLWPTGSYGSGAEKWTFEPILESVDV